MKLRPYEVFFKSVMAVNANKIKEKFDYDNHTVSVSLHNY